MEQPEDIYVSPQTLERMRKELEELTGPGREEMSVRLLRARELGDLKENAEYHAAKDAQGLMEARIRQLEHTISKAVVREVSTSADEVGPGLIVTVKDQYGTEDYLFADSMEEKVDGASTVTPSSPMGRALAGRKVGETATVEAPRGSFTVEIVGLKPL
ncbi:MAG TPA: transcription elongation factor GreA [Actinomycetota bacterium]|jgi:transcription elongation factor GreA|nr:transcription elongation factor GreA [Actinomycetota bacterium]